MYTTIKGRYEKGKLILDEAAPVVQADALVIFQQNGSSPKKPDPAVWLRKRNCMADDFDEPLEELKNYMQ
jgi:hypothetical protein